MATTIKSTLPASVIADADDVPLKSAFRNADPAVENESATPTGKSKKRESRRYPLPNGGEYIARTVPGYENDVEMLRAAYERAKDPTSTRTPQHVLLLGDPGTGKTALLQAALPEAENMVMHSRLSAFDMLWTPRIDKDTGRPIYDPSPLVRAAMKGVPLYVDEIMRGSDDAFTPLFSAMDGRGVIVGGNLDGTDLEIQRGFMVVAASNPLVRGAFLPDAIASRFKLIVTVETGEDLLRQLGITTQLRTIWNNLHKTPEVWTPGVRELLTAQEWLDQGDVAQAAGSLCGWRVPAKDRSTVASVVGRILGIALGDEGLVIK